MNRKSFRGRITGTALASSADTLVRTYCDQHGLDLASFDVSPDGTAIDFRYTLPDWSVLDRIKKAIVFLERSHELLEERQARKEERTWQPIVTAPRDGTWILGLNNRFNCAVIIWDDKNSERPGWIHPFSDLRLSPFWNGACGSEAIYWMPLPDYRHLPEYKLRQKQAAVATAISQDGDWTDDNA